ncbi:MAG: biopolymer transporter ExbD [Blastochloris sp.]|nr:biopolymer transporter ExbD [Blastochloris sp.]
MLFYAFFRSRVFALVGDFESTLTELLIKTYDALAKAANKPARPCASTNTSTPPRCPSQLAPFIDVVMFLLVFFLLTWNVARYEAELSVSLPTAREAETSTRMPGEILINVNQKGEIIVNRRVLSGPELQDILAKVTADFPDQAVILRGDKNTPYQNIINVIDICKSAKVWNIAFTTDSPDKK